VQAADRPAHCMTSNWRHCKVSTGEESGPSIANSVVLSPSTVILTVGLRFIKGALISAPPLKDHLHRTERPEHWDGLADFQGMRCFALAFTSRHLQKPQIKPKQIRSPRSKTKQELPGKRSAHLLQILKLKTFQETGRI